MTLESIIHKDLETIKKIFETRNKDLDVEKFIKSLRIIRKTISIFKNIIQGDLNGNADLPITPEIHFPNDYKCKKKKNAIPKLSITRKLTPYVLDCNEGILHSDDLEISKLRIRTKSTQSMALHYFIELEYFASDDFIPHRHACANMFNKKKLAIVEGCHKCNKFGWILNVCKSCG
ncbi:hypothetical protein MXB_2285 [Myxobolus squamalis]|nr:hypothetical protein MXB_2285 [Myxobolus squamalis]